MIGGEVLPTLQHCIVLDPVLHVKLWLSSNVGSLVDITQPSRFKIVEVVINLLSVVCRLIMVVVTIILVNLRQRGEDDSGVDMDYVFLGHKGQGPQLPAELLDGDVIIRVVEKPNLL